jgi:uncharacterized membrane protein
MSMSDDGRQRDAQHRMEAYLGRLRRRLRGMHDDDAREIVEELRSHIRDKAAASGPAGSPPSGQMTAAAVEQALAALGSPEELASQYLTDDLLARAEVSRSPLRILESLFHWASLSVAGFLVLLGSMVGYFLGVVFILVAALKSFHPRTAGVWVIPSGAGDFEVSIRLGFGSAPLGGREVLGWWIVPLGLAAGCALVMLTTRFAIWCVRQYRKSRALPRG